MRVVVDTSTAFSALISPGHGKPRRVLDSLLLSDKWEVVLSPAMIDELEHALERKHKDTPEVRKALATYLALGTCIDPTVSIKICRDPNDDFILECAISAGASLIVTSDADLLDSRVRIEMAKHDIAIVSVNKIDLDE